GTDDTKADDADHVLPPMNEGDLVTLLKLRGEQHFTEPPPRYSEASLVKALEEHGIGRPSTYATIISTLQDREYAEMDNRRFVPTDIGKIVNRFLTSHFHRYVEYGFTAALEDELDAVSRGEEEWTTPLGKFWKPFVAQVEKVDKNVTREQVAQARELGKDPATGKPITVRMGRYGPFVQIGTKDDEEKPRFAGLRPGQKMDSLTLEQALYLFNLPRTLGSTADGETIVANIGRFGPYLKYGSKYVSLKEDDPYTVTHERALEVIRAKIEADANRIINDFGTDGIQVLNGRYGPYVTDGKKNAKIPKGREPKSLTLEECRELIAQAPERGGGRFGRGRRGAPLKAAAGRAAPAAKAGNGESVSSVAPKASPLRGKKKESASATGAGSSRSGASRTGPPRADAKPPAGMERARPSHAARKPAARGGSHAAAPSHAPAKTPARSSGKSQTHAAKAQPAVRKTAAGAKKRARKPLSAKPTATTRARGTK
ncbi:MAG TPA: topoisomerase C-terminal repeat-containing protein, partial [Steroidobacteraceae bacterium]|nr:topoisomerase C-terminal repeat-containing protein [Steroidobacteraceae bacterium]